MTHDGELTVFEKTLKAATFEELLIGIMMATIIILIMWLLC